MAGTTVLRMQCIYIGRPGCAPVRNRTIGGSYLEGILEKVLFFIVRARSPFECCVAKRQLMLLVNLSGCLVLVAAHFFFFHFFGRRGGASGCTTAIPHVVCLAKLQPTGVRSQDT